jgi:hypothetical protein
VEPRSHSPIQTKGRPAGGYPVALTSRRKVTPPPFPISGKPLTHKPLTPHVRQPPLGYSGPTTPPKAS